MSPSARPRSSSAPSPAREAFSRLRAIFPTIDPTYLERCIQSYQYTVGSGSSSSSSVYSFPDVPRSDEGSERRRASGTSPADPSSESAAAHQRQVDKLVHKVSAKILDANHGYYPSVLFRDMKRRSDASASSSSTAKTSRWRPSPASKSSRSSSWLEREDARDSNTLLSSRKGKERARYPSEPQSGSLFNPADSLLQVDETSTRNAALILLNEMFPAVSLSHLRGVLVQSSHSYVHQALARLLGDPTFAPESPELWLSASAEDLHDTRHRLESLARRPRKDGVVLPKRENPGELAMHDLIRDPTYIDSTSRLLNAQFPNLWQSSIKAVTAENNFDYALSFDAASKLERERSRTVLGKAWDMLRSSFLGSRGPAPSAGLTASSSKSPATPDIPDGVLSLKEVMRDTALMSNMDPTLLYELHLYLSSASRPSDTARRAMSGLPQYSGATATSPSTAPEDADLECGCCFSDISVFEARACANGCVFCRTCVIRTVEETVFGQAPLRLFQAGGKASTPGGDTAAQGDATAQLCHGGEGTGIRCLSIEGCQSPFSDPVLRRTLPDDLYKALEARIATEILRSIDVQSAAMATEGRAERLRVVRCPFCTYAEVQAVPQLLQLIYGQPDHQRGTSITHLFASIFNTLALFFIFAAWSLAALIFFDLLNETSPASSSKTVPAHYKQSHAKRRPVYMLLDPDEALHNIAERVRKAFDTAYAKRNGTVFRCRNSVAAASGGDSSSPYSTTFASPAYIHSLLPPPPVSAKSRIAASGTTANGGHQLCGRTSCLLCHKLYYPGHDCHDSTEGLRLVMETAASNAVKRQCPECLLSFVKLDGCNKVVCRCGYAMCFVCRKGIGAERYSHFCQHVRDPPGSPCNVCTKCDLFKVEDDARAAQQAADEARREWLLAHPEVEQDAMQRHSSLAKGVSRPDPYDATPFVLESLQKLTAWTVDRLLF